MTVIAVAAVDVDEYAPVRPAKKRTRVHLTTVPTPSSGQLTIALETIVRSGWVEAISPHLPQERRQEAGVHLGGRTRVLTVEAVLVGMLLLPVMGRPFLIKDIALLLDQGLDQPTRKRLGIAKKTTVTNRMVSRLWNDITAVINPSPYAASNDLLFDEDHIRDVLDLGPRPDPYTDADRIDYCHTAALYADMHLSDAAARLEAFVRAGLRATYPDDYAHTGDFALDATYVESWENPRSRRRRTKRPDAAGTTALDANPFLSAPATTKKKAAKERSIPVKPHLVADPDARWWSKKAPGKGKLGQRDSESGLGYAVSALTWIEEDRGVNKETADLPRLIDHLTVIGARSSMWRHGTQLLESMVTHHEAEDGAAGREHRVRGDLLADREYTRVDHWHAHAHAMGFTPHFHLAKEQREITRVLASGALVIDGLPYSPGMPERLRVSPDPIMFATRAQRAEQAAWYAERAPYRLRAEGGGRADNGKVTLYCAASTLGGKAIACANKPASLPGKATRITVGTALPVITNPVKPPICQRTKVTVSFDELPFWQPHIPGTAEHQWSVHRRSNVESAFSRIKDTANQSVLRGDFRIVGIAKVTVAILLTAMAANLAEVTRWRDRQSGVTTLDSARVVKTRKPRRLTVKRAQDAERRAESRARREAAEGTAPESPPDSPFV